MKPILFIVLLHLSASPGSMAQKFISGKNHISFYSKAPMEDIEAHTYSAKSIFDTETGEIVFTVPINTFEFQKSLMQEHFNEKYLESDKYPRAKFKGKVTDFQKTSGKQMVTAVGTLEIHGVTKEVSVKGEIDYSSQQITIISKFPLRVADYKIRIPKIVAFNIAEVVDVNIEFIYSPYEIQ
jgi:polyisoprenoid-binding protein YceI